MGNTARRRTLCCPSWSMAGFRCNTGICCNALEPRVAARYLAFPLLLAALAVAGVDATHPGRVLMDASAPSAGYLELINLTAPNVALALANIPNTRRYLFVERAYEWFLNLGTGPTTGTLDMDTGKAVLFNSKYNYACSGPYILGDGGIYFFGGMEASPEHDLLDGRKLIGRFKPTTPQIYPVGMLRVERWYPSPIRTYNGSVLIVGGSGATNFGPEHHYAELWDVNNPRTQTTTLRLPAKFEAQMGRDWYPTMLLLKNGEIVWFIERAGSITDKDFKLLRDLPDLPADITYCTQFPYTAASAILAMAPPYDGVSFVLFGGAPCGGGPTDPAASTSVRLDIYYCGSHPSGICTSDWQVEDMLGVRRVMGDATLLPNGKVFLHGGAQNGHANSGQDATNANYISLMYDPDAAPGGRYSKFDFSRIPRIYHSANCLDPSGKVLVAGCENCGRWQVGEESLAAGMSLSPIAPLEHRIEWAVPAEIAPDKTRPVIVKTPGIISRGTVFPVVYSYGAGNTGTITGASLVAPCTSTHSLKMNQRVVMLPVSLVKPGVVNVVAPPAGLLGKALPGWHLLFLRGEAGTYSEGKWVNLKA